MLKLPRRIKLNPKHLGHSFAHEGAHGFACAFIFEHALPEHLGSVIAIEVLGSLGLCVAIAFFIYEHLEK